VGLTKDAGWEIGVSRTVHRSLDDVWALLASVAGQAIWLGPGADLDPVPGAAYDTTSGIVGEMRSWRPGDRIRLTWRPPTWDHDSTVQVAVTGGTDKTVVRFHQERMVSSAEREQQRTHWRVVMDRLVDELGETS
jgi:uncharacterized protein YndB with AHSA1/START domain